MYFSRRRLLRRGQGFHVCTINKCAHTKKSGNLFNDPRVYIYIYIYIYIYKYTRVSKRSNVIFFSTWMITDTRACIIQQNRADLLWIISLFLNIVTISLNSNVPPSNESMYPYLVKSYWLFLESLYHCSFHFLVNGIMFASQAPFHRAEEMIIIIFVCVNVWVCMYVHVWGTDRDIEIKRHEQKTGLIWIGFFVQ